MKPKLSPFFLVSCIFCLLSFIFSRSALSQVPQGFNYQAVARDEVSGNPIAEIIDVKIAILSDDSPEVVVYEELHSGVDPDDHGLFNIVVGGGVCQTTPVCFDDIDWTISPLFIRTQINYGGWKNMGSSRLWSVPYALLADSLGGPLKKLEVIGETEDLEEAIFEVKNKDGQTVLAVYNEGVRIYVNDVDAKGAKGGFAIGGFGMTKTIPHQYLFVSGDSVRINIDNGDVDKGPKGGFAIGGFGTLKGLTQKYLMVSNDSVRIYIDSKDTDKGPKGGFAIGSYGLAKGKPQDLLTVSNDSVRIYLDKAATDKGPKGGFAIGGYGTTKGEEEEYLRVTRDSTRVYINDLPKKSDKGSSGGFAVGGLASGTGAYNYMKVEETKFKGGKEEYMQFSESNTFIGYKAGNSNPVDNPTYNTFLGYQAGFLNTGAIETYNLFIGHKAGYGSTTGTHNVYMGFESGFDVGENAHNNIFIGKWSGYLTEGSDNIFIGNSSGLRNTSGNGNVFLGLSAGYYNTEGYGNLFLASNAGQENTKGWHNVFMGYAAGWKNKIGNYNLYIGAQAGNQNTNSNNVFLGYQSGFNNLTGTGNVFIGYQSGLHETQSYRLYITNQSGDSQADGRTKALIYGEFDNKIVTINDVLKLTPRSSEPASPVIGMIYVNSTNNHIYCYLGTTWKQLD